jgi:hypothetical protein
MIRVAHPMRAGRTCATLVASTTLVLFAALGGASPASADSASWWHLSSAAAPTLLPRHGEAQLVVTVTNRGYGEVNAEREPVILTDELPVGVKPVRTTSPVNCKIKGQTVTCTFTGIFKPYTSLIPLGSVQGKALVIVAEMEDPREPLANVVMVEGGGIPSPPPLEKPLKLEKAEPEVTPFGVETYEMTPEGEDGSPDTQAGAHPFQLATLLDLNQKLEPDESTAYPGAGHSTEEPGGAWPAAPALPRNLHFKLPPGLLGDPRAVPECSGAEFELVPNTQINRCPADTAVGVASATLFDPGPLRLFSRTVPVFNLEPAPGEPARFGFTVEQVPIVLKTAVPSGGGYGVEVSVEGISQAVSFLSSEVVLWGVPGDPRHDSSRGWGCTEEGADNGVACESSSEPAPKAFLTLPSSCEQSKQAQGTSVSGQSWSAPPSVFEQEFGPLQPGKPGPLESSKPFPTMTGCAALQFNPSIAIEPEQHVASTPTGLNVDVEMEQAGLLAAEGLAESALQETTVTLPEGIQLNPSAANALQACRPFDFGSLPLAQSEGGQLLEGEDEQGSEDAFQTDNEHFTSGSPECPDAAKLGTVNIQTPLLERELTGSLYLAAENTSPFRSPLALYLVAEDPTDGILVKLAGEVTVDEATGQITTTFANTPQLPFSDLQLHLFGGQRGSLSTPPLCGSYAASSEFVPWSGGAPARPGAGFTIDTGPGGTPCPSDPLPFAPGFTAGSASSQAGAFTSFTLQIEKPDGQQQLSAIAVHMPSGIAGLLAKLTPCAEPPLGQEWSCGAESLIGDTTALAGLGSEPVTLPGKAYLTSGYDGAPFGVLVQTPAVAGPFNLGMVNVRSKIEVNPETAAVTITTDPGPRGEAIPTRLKGVPAQLKQVQVTVDRPEFLFNPTNCESFTITGALSGDEGASSSFSYPFGVTNCATLPFHPTLTATVGGKASKADGASLTVKVTSQGLGVANIAKTKLTLPIALPSRLSTIQKACVDSVFESTPSDPGSACDEGSVIGEGIADTPVLKAPLRGPAYLVSHGGAAFPDVEFVLKGEGILLVLDGKTDIKKGITTSEFNSIPDAPVNSFEAILPVGPHSALTANVPEKDAFSLCGQTLEMPTEITGQNGAVINQTTKIAITGCSGVKNFTAKKPTLAQQLAKALAKCRSPYKHSANKRAACERKARATYTAMAVAACRRTDKHNAKKRKDCEADAREPYAARKASPNPTQSSKARPGPKGGRS